MSDPTQRLSQVLHDLAVGAPRAAGMPPRVRRRARIAMARTALGATILVAVTVSAGIATYGNLDRRQDAGPVGQPPAAPETIAFVSDRDGDPDIYSAIVGEETSTDLTRNEASDVSPTWSPDGSQIAFSSDRSGQWGVYVMQADGSNVRRVAVRGTHPAWSPDGRSIAFVSDGLDSNASPLVLSQVFTLELSTGEAVQVTHDDAGAIQPQWSPDGTRLAYSGRQSRIAVIQATGAGERTVTSEGLDLHPVWTPDGALVFARETSLEGNLALRNVYEVDLDGSKARPLTMLAGRSVIPESFSPDGTRLLVSVYEDGVGDVYVMERDGSNLGAVVEGAAHDAEAVWRPTP